VLLLLCAVTLHDVVKAAAQLVSVCYDRVSACIGETFACDIDAAVESYLACQCCDESC
jgi:hypothetical protein